MYRTAGCVGLEFIKSGHCRCRLYEKRYLPIGGSLCWVLKFFDLCQSDMRCSLSNTALGGRIV